MTSALASTIDADFRCNGRAARFIASSRWNSFNAVRDSPTSTAEASGRCVRPHSALMKLAIKEVFKAMGIHGTDHGRATGLSSRRSRCRRRRQRMAAFRLAAFAGAASWMVSAFLAAQCSPRGASPIPLACACQRRAAPAQWNGGHARRLDHRHECACLVEGQASIAAHSAVSNTACAAVCRAALSAG